MNPAQENAIEFLLGYVKRFGDGVFAPQAARHLEAVKVESSELDGKGLVDAVMAAHKRELMSAAPAAPAKPAESAAAPPAPKAPAPEPPKA